MGILTKIKQKFCHCIDHKYLHVDIPKGRVFYECKNCAKISSVHWMGPGSVVDTNTNPWTVV